MNIKEFNRGPGTFLIVYQILFLVTLPIYFYYATTTWGMWAISVALLYLTGISITGGYHRYFSHRSFKTNTFMEVIILFFSSMSLQGSALRWCFDHRLHHAHVDTDDDPYSIKKGFWYAHFLWILEKPRPIDPKVVPDLIKNPLVVFQDRYYEWTAIGTNVFVFLLIGWILNDFWGAFFLATWLRIFALHHFTWFINSLAHTWGDKPFCQEQSAVNNYVIALLTFGEGYHNFHHVYANDYRNGIRWYHFDPTKWVIWSFHKLGMIYNLKIMDPSTIKKRMVIERKTLLLERLTKLWHLKTDEIAKIIDEISERMVAKIARFNQLKLEYKKFKKEKSEKDILKNLKSELKELKKHIRADWRIWGKLSRNIMRMKQLPS
jgi:stearoyl-CoA desaturase (Delta-9 desaturase)